MGACHGIRNGLGIGAGISGCYRHLDRGDGRILLHRKGRHGHKAAKADDDRHDRSEDGTIDEEFGKHGSGLLHLPAAAGPFSDGREEAVLDV